MPTFPFEVTPCDFDGGSDATDHRVVWVLAPTRHDVETALAGTGARVSDLPPSFADEGEINYRMPQDAEALRRFVLDTETPDSANATAPVPSGFDAMGQPIPAARRQAAYEACKAMGLTDREVMMRCVSGMAEQLERDKPFEAQQIAMQHVDLTGAYRLMAVLLTDPNTAA